MAQVLDASGHHIGRCSKPYSLHRLLLLSALGFFTSHASALQPRHGQHHKLMHTVQELTFFVASDTHFGHVDVQGNDAATKNQWAIDAMHDTVGVRYPESLGGGRVGPPHALVMTGDLVDHGEEPSMCEQQWQQFEEFYGLNGTDGKVLFPVYEGFGNHDGANSTDDDPTRCNVVRRSVIDRNKQRAGLTNVSSNGLHYSWNWGPLHLVMLNLFPGNVNELHPFGAGSWNNPEYSFKFLLQDLTTHVGLNSDAPIIIFHHYGFDLQASKIFWSDHERALYLAAIEPFNVIGVVHGHTHVCDFYDVDGLDVFNAPATQRENATDALPPSFLVFNLDFKRGSMRVGQREGDRWTDNTLVKKFSGQRMW